MAEQNFESRIKEGYRRIAILEEEKRKRGDDTTFGKKADESIKKLKSNIGELEKKSKEATSEQKKILNKQKREQGATKFASGAYEGSGLAGTKRALQGLASWIPGVDSPYKDIRGVDKASAISRDVADVALLGPAGVAGAIGGATVGGALEATGAGKKIGKGLQVLQNNRTLNLVGKNVSAINKLTQEMKDAVDKGDEKKIAEIKDELQKKTAVIPEFIRRAKDLGEGLIRTELGIIAEAGPAMLGLTGSRVVKRRPTAQKELQTPRKSNVRVDNKFAETFRQTTGKEFPRDFKVDDLATLNPQTINKFKQDYGNAFRNMMTDKSITIKGAFKDTVFKTSQDIKQKPINFGEDFLKGIREIKRQEGKTIGNIKKITTKLPVDETIKKSINNNIDEYLKNQNITTPEKLRSSTIEAPIVKALRKLKDEVNEAKNVDDILASQRDINTLIKRTQEQGRVSQSGVHLVNMNKMVDDVMEPFFNRNVSPTKPEITIRTEGLTKDDAIIRDPYKIAKSKYANLKAVDNNFVNAFEKQVKAKAPEKLPDTVLAGGSGMLEDLQRIWQYEKEGPRPLFIGEAGIPRVMRIGDLWDDVAVADVFAKSTTKGVWDPTKFRKRMEKIDEVSGGNWELYFKPSTAKLMRQIDDVAEILDEAGKSSKKSMVMKNANEISNIPIIKQILEMLNGIYKFNRAQFAKPTKMGLGKGNIQGLKIGDVVIDPERTEQTSKELEESQFTQDVIRTGEGVIEYLTAKEPKKEEGKK